MIHKNSQFTHLDTSKYKSTYFLSDREYRQKRPLLGNGLSFREIATCFHFFGHVLCKLLTSLIISNLRLRFFLSNENTDSLKKKKLARVTCYFTVKLLYRFLRFLHTHYVTDGGSRYLPVLLLAFSSLFLFAKFSN